VRRRLIALGAAFAFAFVGTRAIAADGPYQPTLESLDRHPVPEWYQDAKFGIFIHWAVFAVPAYASPTFFPLTALAEWYWKLQQTPGSPAWLHHLLTHGPFFVYDDFIPQWRAEHWDPDAWIQLFEDAGARYFILVAKHKDGFALWPTDTSHRDSVDMGPGRDVLGELFAAARERGTVKGAVHYSMGEWFSPAPNPDLPIEDPQNLVTYLALARWGTWRPRNAYTLERVPYTGYVPIEDYGRDQVYAQLTEIIDRYHPWEIWCDLGGNHAIYYHSHEWMAHFYNQADTYNPGGVVVNDRCGSGAHADIAVVEDEGIPFQLGADKSYHETDQTMSHSWGYNTEELESDYKTTGDLVHNLVDAVANASNYVVNIGPRADGTIPEIMADRLRGIGRWLAINGEAIYGTRPWTQASDGDLRFTVGKTGAFYVTSLVWPGAEMTINAPVPIADDSVIVLLGSDGAPLAWHRNGASIVVEMPAGGDAEAATASRDAFVLRITCGRGSAVTLR
jgi:alpha-L-fucosidase